MWSEIVLMFQNYIGDGLAAGLFLAAFLYLLFTEKDRTKRIILLYTSLVVMVLFFCPLFAAEIFQYLDAETYYRILWLVPMTVVIAYGGVRLTTGCLTDEKVQQREEASACGQPSRHRGVSVRAVLKKGLGAAAALCVCAAIVLTGDYVYDNPYFGPAENRFHVPQTVALVCDAIIVEGREVRAVFPNEMLPYVRQYTNNIRMPYGREMEVSRWAFGNELYDAMNEEILDGEKLAAAAAGQGCHYIIVHETRQGQEELEKNGYHYVETVAGYCIYLQDGAYLGVDFAGTAQTGLKVIIMESVQGVQESVGQKFMPFFV